MPPLLGRAQVFPSTLEKQAAHRAPPGSPHPGAHLPAPWCPSGYTQPGQPRRLCRTVAGELASLGQCETSPSSAGCRGDSPGLELRDA